MKCSNKLCKYNDDYYRDNCRNTIHAELAIQCMKNGFNHYEPADLPQAGAKRSAYAQLSEVRAKFNDFIKNQKSIPAEFVDFINKNFWDLI